MAAGPIRRAWHEWNYRYARTLYHGIPLYASQVRSFLAISTSATVDAKRRRMIYGMMLEVVMEGAGAEKSPSSTSFYHVDQFEITSDSGEAKPE